MHVLVVESDPILCRSLEFALALHGHRLTTAATAAAALDRVRQETFPLIIMGQTPDAADPATLCQTVRALGVCDRSTLLILAPRDQPETIVRALDAGASGYLAWPIDMVQLRGHLDRLQRLERIEASAGTASSSPDPSDLRARALIEHAPQLLLIIDGGGTIAWAAPSVETLLGRHPAQLAHSSLYTICHPEDAPAIMQLLDRALNDSSIEATADLRLLHADGSWREMELVARDLQHDPRVNGMLLLGHDITARNAELRGAERRALHDPLTGLPNRALFQVYLEHALARSERRGQPVVVMFLDLDDLAAVNEMHGRAAGDDALVEAGRRLREALRATDTAARMGEDEFTVLLEDVATEHEATIIAERMIQRLRQPFEIAIGPDGERRVSVRLSVSIGMAVSQPGIPAGPGQSRLVDLLRWADIALYQAKSGGKDRWVMADPHGNGGIGAGQPRQSSLPQPGGKLARMRGARSRVASPDNPGIDSSGSSDR